MATAVSYDDRVSVAAVLPAALAFRIMLGSPFPLPPSPPGLRALITPITDVPPSPPPSRLMRFLSRAIVQLMLGSAHFHYTVTSHCCRLSRSSTTVG